MEVVFIWERIIIGSSIVSIVAPLIVGILAFKWIWKTYVSDDQQKKSIK